MAGSDLPADTLHGLRLAIDRKHTAEVRRLAGNLAPVLTQLMDAAGTWQNAFDALTGIVLPGAARAAIDRVAAIAKRVAEVEPDLAMTVDPVENRGFEYYTGFGFSLFARGVRGELGRGGRYQIDGGDGLGSTGFTLYMETVLRALPEPTQPKRLYLPFGVAVDHVRRLREQGWVTIAALKKDPDPGLEAARLGCTHILKDGAPIAL